MDEVIAKILGSYGGNGWSCLTEAERDTRIFDVAKIVKDLTSKCESKYPNNMTKEQWRKWVACEAMKGMIPTQMFTQASIIENAYEMADDFLKEGDRDE